MATLKTAGNVESITQVEQSADSAMTTEEWKADVTERLAKIERVVGRFEKGGIATTAVLLANLFIDRLPEILPHIIGAFK